ncbi:hypothetical protein [Rhodoblastus sp.]|jgi:hypothetical protein|uniref:hypothetical protein n=1 Tax=Rhodoblastus sp. TaxID=1962975 RepID=UPI0025F9E51A|nr:hypothetical protein [Rhodoblastus sp.]
MADVDDGFSSGILTLWRCIGCGAMGNAAECSGSCDFKRNFVIDAQRHADLLEFHLNLMERSEALRRFVAELAASTEDLGRFLSASASLRGKARALAAEPPLQPRPDPAPDDERMEIWVCRCCGQVEAFRDCLGVCIRRNGDFVLSVEHDRIAREIEVMEAQVRILAAIARQVAWTSPKPGQEDAMRLALREHMAQFHATDEKKVEIDMVEIAAGISGG